MNLTAARVLIVDDSAPFTEVVSQILTAFGVPQLTCCASVDEAQARCELEVFDLILSDVEMPGKTGYDFLLWLRKSVGANSAAPVVMLTGHSSLGKVMQARDAGANFLIAKPIEPRVLLERIRWIANDIRPIIRVETYVGPDRRFKTRFPNPGRRVGDAVELAPEEAAVELSQEGIDALFG